MLYGLTGTRGYTYNILVVILSMVKTTIEIEDELYKKFSIKVIQQLGGRKKNDVITELIKEFVKNG